MARKLKATVNLTEGVAAAVVAIEGDVCAASRPILERALREAAATGAGKVVLAFREQDEFPSSAVAALVHAIRDGQAGGTSVRIAHPSSHVRWTLGIMGITGNVEVFATTDEALAGW